MQEFYTSEPVVTDTTGTHGHTPDDTLTLLSAALDEVYRLRRALAYEARVVEAHTLDLKSLSRTRRMILAAAVQRMRGGVTSSAKAYSGISYKSLDSEARRFGFEYLTVQSWADEVAAKATS